MLLSHTRQGVVQQPRDNVRLDTHVAQVCRHRPTKIVRPRRLVGQPKRWQLAQHGLANSVDDRRLTVRLGEDIALIGAGLANNLPDQRRQVYAVRVAVLGPLAGDLPP